MKTSSNLRTVSFYFFLAYAISWLIWLPLVLAGQGWVERDVPPFLQALGFMGPMLAAIIVTGTARGLPGIKQLLSGLFRFRVSWRWYAFVLLAPPLLISGAAVINYLVLSEWPNWQGYGRIEDLFPGLGLLGTAVLHFLVVGVGEEVGWRGFALPRLIGRIGNGAFLCIHHFPCRHHLYLAL
jgi:membrane protease YdiL (CAAX protease family)